MLFHLLGLVYVSRLKYCGITDENTQTTHFHMMYITGYQMI